MSRSPIALICLFGFLLTTACAIDARAQTLHFKDIAALYQLDSGAFKDFCKEKQYDSLIRHVKEPYYIAFTTRGLITGTLTTGTPATGMGTRRYVGRSFLPGENVITILNYDPAGKAEFEALPAEILAQGYTYKNHRTVALPGYTMEEDIYTNGKYDASLNTQYNKDGSDSLRYSVAYSKAR